MGNREFFGIRMQYNHREAGIHSCNNTIDYQLVDSN